METQLARVYGQYQRERSDLARNLYLANLRDRNEVLFYRLLTEHIAEMLPVVYTPTVGTAIERYSLEYGRPRGVYLSVDHPGQIQTAFANYGLGPDEVDLIVATDSEGILGIGDWGAGGIAIALALGKLALYVAAAGWPAGGATAPSPSSPRWLTTPNGRSSCRCPTRPRCPRPSPPT